MRNRRPSAEHQEAVSRRLALLSHELATISPSPGAGGWPEVDAGPPEPPSAPVDDGHTRVRAAPVLLRRAVAEPLPGPPDEEDGPPPLPSPGRHAARRSRRPDAPPGTTGAAASWRDRLVLGPAQLAVVAVAVAVGLAVTTWWVARGEPQPVAAPVPGSPAAPLATPAAVPVTPSPTTGAGEGAELTVDVAGKVRRPGIVVLPAGSRVVDAIEAAGGARAGVDLGTLNLARPLVDGEQVVVGVPVPAGVVGSLGATPAPTPGVLVNLNTAGQAELETLPEVGPVTAQAILAWRTEHGGFTAVDELLEVDGIGDPTFSLQPIYSNTCTTSRPLLAR